MKTIKCCNIYLGSDDARVEGRRKRTEKDKQRKMEEDLLRDLEMKCVLIFNIYLVFYLWAICNVY